MTVTAIVAAIGNGSDFKNGRHLAAWPGLFRVNTPVANGTTCMASLKG